MKNILIVDDHHEALNIIADTIEKSGLGYEIFVATKAPNALQIAKKENIDLVITDWEMPEMNGIEFIGKLKQMQKLKHLPVIICTGVMTASIDLKTALDTGAVDYIRKPIDKIELIARINAVFQYTEMMQNYFQQKEKLRQQEQKIIKQQNIILKQEKEKADKEMVAKSLQVVRLNNILNKISDELQEAISLCPNQTECSLYEVINNINSKINNSFWSEFEKHFNHANSEMFGKITQKLPELTPNEKRLCMFITMGLTTKDISIITMQEPNTIDVARYRLRKKLNLEHEQNLYEYLQQKLNG